MTTYGLSSPFIWNKREFSKIYFYRSPVSERVCSVANLPANSRSSLDVCVDFVFNIILWSLKVVLMFCSWFLTIRDTVWVLMLFSHSLLLRDKQMSSVVVDCDFLSRKLLIWNPMDPDLSRSAARMLFSSWFEIVLLILLTFCRNSWVKIIQPKSGIQSDLMKKNSSHYQKLIKKCIFKLKTDLLR